MFGLSSDKNRMREAELAAISNSQGRIEFSVDGRILDANENFLRLMGYRLDEVKGQHHSMFVDPAYRASPAYQEFWAKLVRGEFQTAEFQRFGKGGKEVWIQATYALISDAANRPARVVKYAIDVTEQKRRNSELDSQIAAINRSQAVINFTLEGVILDANENFLAVMGYGIEEVRGVHHRLFVDPAYRDSPDYVRFWEELRAGRFQTAEFKRLGKGGREVWIQATYTPIMGADGKPFKVVKFATDITVQVQERHRRSDAQRQIDVELGEMAQALSDASLRSASAAAAAAQTGGNVQSVAAGAEQLLASVKEISRQVSHASDISSSAVNQADRVSDIVKRLEEATGKIGDVAKLIGDIAGQTNLLALNATIEAARAGEAGKGFAVVATEVKNLATQTARATGEISSQINAVQSSSHDAVIAIGEITGTINRINEVSSGIAAAVEEQSAVTGDIARNMQVAAAGVDQITNDIRSVSQAADMIDKRSQKLRSLSLFS
jgi:methyl-accepting chemotaxis protein